MVATSAAAGAAAEVDSAASDAVEEAPADRPDARERLLAAAVEAFAAKGFHGTTTRDIASAAGMSPAALYVHHRSKEDLLHLISRNGHERTLALLREAAATSDDPVEQLRAVMLAFTVQHAREHTTARVVNYELAALSPPHREQIMELRRAIDHEVRRVVERGMASGAFRSADPGLAASAVLSLGIDVARWFRDDGAWTPEQVGHYYADIAVGLLT